MRSILCKNGDNLFINCRFSYCYAKSNSKIDIVQSQFFHNPYKEI